MISICLVIGKKRQWQGKIELYGTLHALFHSLFYYGPREVRTPDLTFILIGNVLLQHDLLRVLVFPQSTPCRRLSSHKAFHQSEFRWREQNSYECKTHLICAKAKWIYDTGNKCIMLQRNTQLTSHLPSTGCYPRFIGTTQLLPQLFNDHYPAI